ncbi:MAG TPA: YncE family protein, partial [Chthonomonadales bacterium]|nr:YncE family protein [Chthonomonadales bacterium]
MRPLAFSPAVIAVLACCRCPGQAPAGSLPAGQAPGTRGDWILPNGRRITPEGRRVVLGNFPMGLALSPSGKAAFTVNCGAGRQSVQVIDLARGVVTQTAPMHTCFNGIAVSPDGSTLWVAGGGANQLFRFRISDNRLSRESSLPLSGYPTGLAVAGNRLYVTLNLGKRLAVVDTTSGRVLARIETGAYPFAVCARGDIAYVTNWGDGTVSVIDTARGRSAATIRTGALPTAILCSSKAGRVYVANANSDTISVLDTTRNRVIQTARISPYPGSPQGCIPDGLAISPDEQTLYVALAGTNAVAAYSTSGLSLRRLYPTAWYPTNLAISSNGATLYTVSSKGVGSGPNVDGQYIGHSIRGVLTETSAGAGRGVDVDSIRRVAANNGYISRLPRNAGGRPFQARATRVGPPIRHVVLIV